MEMSTLKMSASVEMRVPPQIEEYRASLVIIPVIFKQTMK